MSNHAAISDRRRAARKRLLLRTSLTRVLAEESGLQVWAERLEIARRLHPQGLLPSLQLRDIVQEYVLAKSRSDSAMETLRSNWLSVRREGQGGPIDG